MRVDVEAEDSDMGADANLGMSVNIGRGVRKRSSRSRAGRGGADMDLVVMDLRRVNTGAYFTFQVCFSPFMLSPEKRRTFL